MLTFSGVSLLYLKQCQSVCVDVASVCAETASACHHCSCVSLSWLKLHKCVITEAALVLSLKQGQCHGVIAEAVSVFVAEAA